MSDEGDILLPKNSWIKISKKLFSYYGVRPNKLVITTSDKDGDDSHSKAFYDLYNRVICINLDKAKSNKDLLTSILHEIHHMIDEKKLGHDTYDIMYQDEMANNSYKRNKFEISAENFALGEVDKWKHLIHHK